MRHVLTALRSPAKTSTLNNGTLGVATTTWYDVPAPIIVHCREFHEEARHDVAEHEENKKSYEKEIKVGSIDKNTEAGSFEKEIRTKDLASSEKNIIESSKKDTMTIARPSSFNETLYQNKEAVLNDRNRKRHSTTVELNATTMIKTDADGVPTISFSFLHVDEKFHNDDEEIVILEVDTSDRAENSSENQLYDLPKSAVPSRVSLEQSDDKQTNVESSSPTNPQILYDVPKSAKDASLNKSQEEEAAMTRSNVSFEKRKQPRDRTKRSTRSLKSGRRSYGASDSDGYDAGIASMSGSYSDPECPNEEGSMSGGSDRSRRIKLQKRRLGKAWGRMRSWLREERTRIGEVVNRHARLQAVGALSPEVAGKKERS